MRKGDFVFVGDRVDSVLSSFQVRTDRGSPRQRRVCGQGWGGPRGRKRQGWKVFVTVEGWGARLCVDPNGEMLRLEVDR